MFVNNFSKCGRIFNFFDQLIHKKILYMHTTKISTSPALCCYITLWKSEIQKYDWFWQHPQQTVDMVLRTLWSWTLDLTFNSS